MPFESQWARIPLALRWGISMLVGVAVVVAIVVYVSHHNGNGLAHVGTAAEERENHEATVIVGQDQAPQTVHLGTGASASTVLRAAVRRDMRHRIATGNLDGPLQTVSCHQSGRRGDRIGFRCNAKADGENYPFLAVATPSAHHAVYCKRDIPPAPTENIPVSSRCRL